MRARMTKEAVMCFAFVIVSIRVVSLIERRRQRRRSEVTGVSLSSAALFGVCSLLPWQP